MDQRIIDGMQGENFDERDDEIVGLQTEKVENMSENANKKALTVEQKVERELTYVTQAMGLDVYGQKHWRYKLKREYEQQEKTRKRLERL